MKINEKDIVLNVVQDFLTESDPEALPEFELVFDDVYQTIDSNNTARELIREGSDEEAMSFDSGVVSQTIVSLACFVAISLVKATLKDFVRRDLPLILDKMETRLSEITGKPRLVRAIRERVEGILQSL